MPTPDDRFSGTVEVGPDELKNPEILYDWLRKNLPDCHGKIQLRRYPGGYSNLTYWVQWEDGAAVLRRPPAGAMIRTAHDMDREYRVLQALKPVYHTIPQPIIYCEENSLIGTPFYIMERVEGRILRYAKGIEQEYATLDMKAIASAMIANLAALHAIDITDTGLQQLGKPEGYVQRQVMGWIGRFEDSITDEIPEMKEVAGWLRSNIPPDLAPALLHNDYKFDNIVLDPSDPLTIRAVLDWEMATIGDPFMDLGTTLAYWTEAGDPEVLRPFNLSWLPGNPDREQLTQLYAHARGIDIPNLLFYYVFGCFKVGVIVQQIYRRYKMGQSKDPRFASLFIVLKACGQNAAKAIRLNRISRLYAS